jgi:putative phosphoesterase
MLVAIISDIHNNETNLQKVLNFCKEKEIDTIICCGDLASEETLDFLNDNFSGTVHYAFGNMDNEQLRKLKFVDEYRNTILHKDFGETVLDSKKIAFVHFPEDAQELAKTGKYDFVFHGHTHKPWEEMIELPASAKAPARQCKVLNPGNVAGEIFLPTFAVWETDSDKFELVRVHDLK